MTEVLYALSAKDDIIGVTTFCDYPEDMKKIYKVGDFSNPSLERIVGLKPDLVIVNMPEQMRIKQALETMKVKVFISSPQSLEDIYNEIRAIGKIIEKEKTADSLISYMRNSIRSVENSSRKKVYIELAPKPIVTIGAKSYLNELLIMAGGENLFKDLEGAYPVVAQEEIIKRNPDIIVVLHPEKIKDRLGWSKISAVRNNYVYSNLNQDHLLRPGPRLVQGFQELVKVLHE